jgi:hypothetical protein
MPTDENEDGVPIFLRNAGGGFLIVVEARAGSSFAPPGTQSVSAGGRPDLQMQVDRSIGNGSPDVCDTSTMDPNNPPGGVPGISPPSVDPGSQMITDAMNDLGCRFTFNNSLSPCTQTASGLSFANSRTTAQFCSIAVVDFGFERFPLGDTLITMRWRDQGGNFSEVRRIIVRVQPPS